MPKTLKKRSKDEFMTFEKGCMSVASYEAKLHALSRYFIQLVTIEDDRIRLYINGLYFELQVLSIHMNLQ